MLTLLAKILKVLNSEDSPWQIGWAAALGLLAGLLPFGLITLVILLIVSLFTVNLSTFLLVWGVSGGIMLLLGPAVEAFTWRYAQNPDLLQLLGSVEALQLLHFHHTLVLGAFVLGIILLLPTAWITTFMVRQYRTRLMVKIQKWKVVQVLKASKLVQIYEALN